MTALHWIILKADITYLTKEYSYITSLLPILATGPTHLPHPQGGGGDYIHPTGGETIYTQLPFTGERGGTMTTYTTYRTTSTGGRGEPWPWRGRGGGSRTWNICIYIYMCVCVYMCIYIYREREREWESMYFIGCWSPSQNPYNYTMETGYIHTHKIRVFMELGDFNAYIYIYSLMTPAPPKQPSYISP